MFTASPVRKPSPEPGVTSRRTSASPVLTPTRTSRGVPSGRVMPSSACDDAQAGPHGALGVVLVRGGHAEDADHGVADELLDRAAVRLDHLAGGGVVGAQHGVDVLGVGGLAHRGEADEVAEERGDDLALFGCGGGRSQPRAAAQAEARRLRQFGGA